MFFQHRAHAVWLLIRNARYRAAIYSVLPCADAQRNQKYCSVSASRNAG